MVFLYGCQGLVIAAKHRLAQKIFAIAPLDKHPFRQIHRRQTYVILTRSFPKNPKMPLRTEPTPAARVLPAQLLEFAPIQAPTEGISFHAPDRRRQVRGLTGDFYHYHSFFLGETEPQTKGPRLEKWFKLEISVTLKFRNNVLENPEQAVPKSMRKNFKFLKNVLSTELLPTGFRGVAF